MPQMAWVNHRARSLSLNAQMASNHHTSLLVYKRAARSSWHRNFYLHNRGSVVSSIKFINCISFLILASFKPFSARALSWRPCAHTHSKRTHNARFSLSLSHTHTHTHTPFALRMRSAVSIFSALMLTDQSVHTAHGCGRRCVPGAVRLQQCSTIVSLY